MKIFLSCFLAISMFMMTVMAVASLGMIIGAISPELHEEIMSVLKS